MICSVSGGVETLFESIIFQWLLAYHLHGMFSVHMFWIFIFGS